MPAKGTYLPYLEARDFVRSLGLKSASEWWDEYSKKDRPRNIPSTPNEIYKNLGWISWMDWLGTNNPGPRERKYNVNDNYFKKWSPNEAYILGFWFADGNIGKNKYTCSYYFTITQHKKDKYLMDAILKEMDSNYPTSKNANCFAFKMCSKIIYDDIVRLGGKPRKSLDVKFPSIPEKYLPDFVRGLWDGDGCVFHNKKAKSYCSSYDSGSNDFINGLYCVLKKNIPNLNGSLYRRRRRSTHKVTNQYCLYFGKDDTVRLKKFMYQEPLKGKLMLKRKYDLFLKSPDFCKHEFLDYNGAQKIVKSFGIKNYREWIKYCKSGLIPHNIPHSPVSVYRNSGWVGFNAWLGTQK